MAPAGKLVTVVRHPSGWRGVPPGNRSKASAPPWNRVSVQGFEPAL